MTQTIIGSTSAYETSPMTNKSEGINANWTPEPALWTRAQAAAYLNVSVRTVNNLLARKELVRRKIGSRALIPRSSVESFLRRDHSTK
jgi:excisionase family DNA binding protein